MTKYSTCIERRVFRFAPALGIKRQLTDTWPRGQRGGRGGEERIFAVALLLPALPSFIIHASSFVIAITIKITPPPRPRIPGFLAYLVASCGVPRFMRQCQWAFPFYLVDLVICYVIWFDRAACWQQKSVTWRRGRCVRCVLVQYRPRGAQKDINFFCS